MSDVTVWVVCDYCDDPKVQLQPDELRLFLTHPSGGGTYMFEHCGQINIRPANQRVASTLLSVGVPVDSPDPIRQLRESSERIISSFACQMDSVSTPADMGFVS